MKQLTHPISLLDPPEGGAASLVRDPDGVRIRLRSHGAERWLGGGFLLFWLFGWAAGERFALQQVFGPLSEEGGASFDLSGKAFLLFWLAAWTLGGIGALTTVLRLFAGTDELWLGPDGLRLWKGVGRFGRRRFLAYSDLLDFDATNNRLSVDTPSGKLELTSLGSAADRKWLYAALRGLFGAPVRTADVPDTFRTTQPPPEPTDWIVRRDQDGRVILSTPVKTRVMGVGILLFITLFWNGILSGFVAGGLGLISKDNIEAPAEVGSPLYWLFLTPFLLVGLCMFAFLIRSIFVSEERCVSHNRMETRKRVLGREWSSASPKGYFTIDSSSSEGSTTYTLVLVSGITRERIDSGNRSSLRSLGLFLAHHTGWPFQVSPEDLSEIAP